MVMLPNPIPFPIKAVFFDLDGVIVEHPAEGHNRLDYQRLKFLEKICLESSSRWNDIPLIKAEDKLRSYWSSRDPLNILSTDFSFALAMISNNYDLNYKGTLDEIKRAKTLIYEADMEYKRLQYLLPDLENYEHNPELVKLTEEVKRQNPEAGFFPNSGNSKELTWAKTHATGLHKVLTMDKLPDNPPIFGEDIHKRSDGVDWILKNADIPRGKGAVLLLSDRLADAAALKNIPGYDEDYHIFFGDNPFINPSEEVRRASNSLLSFPLASANREGRVLFVPPNLKSEEKIGLVGGFLSVNKPRLHPEGQSLRVS